MISIITPSVRPEMLDIVKMCLKRQTFKDFEWLVVGAASTLHDVTWIFGNDEWGKLVQEPLKHEGDYYSLNKAWNEGFRQSKGDLLVSIVDGLWFPPDTLEKLWNHYEENPKAIVGTNGHQYDRIEHGKPEHMVWTNPLSRTDLGSFYEVDSINVEWCLASIPRNAIFDVGGMEEEFDKGAALSEKEANLRMQHAGYSFYLDQGLEYRAIHHERLSKEWDEKYKIACDLWTKYAHEILTGKRLKLSYI